MRDMVRHDMAELLMNSAIAELYILSSQYDLDILHGLNAEPGLPIFLLPSRV